MSGATGIPSAVADPSTLRSLRCRILVWYHLELMLPARGVLFEQHRRGAVIAANVVDDFFEGIRELLALRFGQTIEDRQQPFLHDRRRVLQQRTAGASQIEDEPPRIAISRSRVTSPASTSRVTTTETEALIGERARREIVQR